jgi:beta-galactosidase
MSQGLSRRSFLSSAATAGVVSALRIDMPSSMLAEGGSIAGRSSFDDRWRFYLGDSSDAHLADFDDSGWRPLDLPHDWSIEGAFSEDAPAAGNGAYLPTGIGWYRKQFLLPAEARGKRVSLTFDGVYQRSEVWVNGKSMGMRPNGFVTFSYDVTDHLNPSGKPNHVAVRVDNSLQRNCRWYTGSGIYRHTWLEITDPVHIAKWGTCIRTSAVTTESADVEVTTRVLNEGTRDAACEIAIEILDPNGNVVQRDAATRSIASGSEETLSWRLKITSPALWPGAAPNLYSVRSTLRSSGKEVDRETTTFGIRDIQFDADRGFLLNGEHVKLNGVCIHGDGGSVGTAVPERVWERRLELLREMGCNAIRLSHNPPAPELLDMLDRMGFLVMDEAFDEWKQPKGGTPVYGYHKYFDEWSERDMNAMVERDRNHPSIVIWSAGNEVPDQSDAHGPETLRKLMAIIRAKDPTRPITVGCDQISAEPNAALPEFLEQLDVVGYNYVDRWRDRREKYYSIDRQAYPKRKFIGTESSSFYSARGVYAIDQSNELFFEKASNAAIGIEQQQKFVQTYDYVSGDFLWVGIDYLGEARWPSKLAPCGSLDTCGFRKDSFYFFQSLWSKTPVLHLLPHWNWAGKEGQAIPVTCYTNCDTVELFLNGKSLGVKGFAFPRPGMEKTYGDYPARAKVLQTTGDLHLSWDVIYAPGTLTAKGTKDGRVILTTEIATAGAASSLSLRADRGRIRTSRADVAHITVEVLDAAGRVVPTANNAISFALEGEGRILGVDNGQPDSHESYKGDRRSAFNGMALVLLQSNGRSGTMTLTALSPSLASAHVTVEAS